MELQQNINQIRDIKYIRIAIWIYFWLLLFEGALRKWVLPGLSDALLIVRDPVAIYILVLGIKNRLLEHNNYFKISVAASLLSFFTTMIWGHHNITVAIYGVRIMLFHFPLIFIIGQVFSVKDVLLLGKFLIIMALPMAILISLQFYSPQSAWVNRGLGGNLAGAGFEGANGYMRPPGVFSFISGSVFFWGLLTSYTLFYILEKKIINKYLVYLAVFSILLSLIFSISRSLFFGVLISVIVFIIITGRKPQYILSTLFAISLLMIIGYFISRISVFSVGIDAFITRFSNASEVEGGLKGTLVDRFLGGMIGAITDDPNLSFWGKGIGMGTNAGAKLMTGKADFLISEGEWGRLVGESGFILGMTFILLRLSLIWKMTYQSIEALKIGNTLPCFLLSFGLINILQGQWAQPTSLGFAVLSGGLILAALKKPTTYPMLYNNKEDLHENYFV